MAKNSPDERLYPLFLIGFMGSGKSTLGRRLAKKTGRLFIDLDDHISQSAGMGIPEYFQLYGEGKFRELERNTLLGLPLAEAPVIAAGGGTPCFYDNMAWMNAQGTTVYLKLPPSGLVRRLIQGAEGTTSRPLLAGKTPDELLDFISTKLAEREPYYLRAGNILDATGLTVDNLITYLQL